MLLTKPGPDYNNISLTTENKIMLNQPIQKIAQSLNNASADDLMTSYLAGANSHKIELSNKNQGNRYISSILYLLQGDLSGCNICPKMTASCKEVCLGTHSGHAAMIKKGEKTNKVQVARLKRTLLCKNYPDVFASILFKELEKLGKCGIEKDVIPCFRFNGSSDLNFQRLTIPGSSKITFIEYFGQVYNMKFYDYTKSYNKMVTFLNGGYPTNYHLTYSYTPENEEKAKEILNMGGNVAVVFDEKSSKKHAPSFIGKSFLGHEIISGDEHDLRFTDPQGGYVVGITKKGNSKSSKGFFVNPSLAA
jgi:hypothetical protein